MYQLYHKSGLLLWLKVFLMLMMEKKKLSIRPATKDPNYHPCLIRFRKKCIYMAAKYQKLLKGHCILLMQCYFLAEKHVFPCLSIRTRVHLNSESWISKRLQLSDIATTARGLIWLPDTAK